MAICIICREEKTNFNDEHVIPDSIGGYYHIKKVCVECNGLMGQKIDIKLTNHQFIEFQRHLLGIKGKKGSIPNPLKGTHILTDIPEQKVQLFINEEGKFDTKLIPIITNSISNDGKFTIVIDAKNEKEIETITEKFLKRNGIPKEQVRQERQQKSIEHPNISINLKIDIHNFKLSILKIAYEFAVDMIPNYFNDTQAILISKLLHDADFNGLEKIIMFGDGLNNQLLEPFSHLINFEDNNHYLILFDSQDYGLLCFVNLFNCFFLGFQMSTNSGFIKDYLLVGKNDIVNKTFKVYTANEILSSTYTPIAYRFQYWLPDKNSLDEFLDNNKSPYFGYYQQGKTTPFFDKHGNIKYANIDTKLQQEHLVKKGIGDVKNEIITEILLDDEELYIKLLPINKLYRVLSVKIEQYKRDKL